MKKKIFILVSISFLSGGAIMAQSRTEKTDSVQTSTTIENKNAIKKELDTEESILYMGEQLLFQVKKRLNLTTEEEEKRVAKEKKVKVFNILGIRIERD